MDSELSVPLVEESNKGKMKKFRIFLFGKTGSLVKEVLSRFWSRNESTLDLVDGLTTSVAELQDTCAYVKEGGHAADTSTTETGPIIFWLAKVQQVQNPEGPQPWTRDWNGKSEDIVFDMNASERSLHKMKERINYFLQSYDLLLDDFELVRRKLVWNKRCLGNCGILRVALARLASVAFVITGVGFMVRGNTLSDTISGMILAIPGLGASVFLWSCETVALEQEDELARTGNRVKQTIATLRNISTTVDELTEGSLETLASSISGLQTAIGELGSRDEILDVNPEVREKGRNLVRLCNTLDLKLSELGKQIQVLRDQLVSAQHSRYKIK